MKLLSTALLAAALTLATGPAAQAAEEKTQASGETTTTTSSPKTAYDLTFGYSHEIKSPRDTGN